MSRRPQSGATLLGLAFGVSGAAHLMCPRAFEGVNRLAFNDAIRRHVIVNGIIETARGIAILESRTRRAAYLATAVYSAYFIGHVLYRERLPQLRRPSQAESRRHGTAQ